MYNAQSLFLQRFQDCHIRGSQRQHNVNFYCSHRSRDCTHLSHDWLLQSTATEPSAMEEIKTALITEGHLGQASRQLSTKLVLGQHWIWLAQAAVLGARQSYPSCPIYKGHFLGLQPKNPWKGGHRFRNLETYKNITATNYQHKLWQPRVNTKWPEPYPQISSRHQSALYGALQPMEESILITKLSHRSHSCWTAAASGTQPKKPPKKPTFLTEQQPTGPEGPAAKF